MKISKLIEELVYLWIDHDDIEVFHVNQCCCYGDSEDEPVLSTWQWKEYPLCLQIHG